jgi:HTH-type transcriptional regulator / antitoxin HigA
MRGSLDFSQPHVLRDEGEFEAAVARVETLLDLDPPSSSAEHEELEFLSVLIEAYEAERDDWPEATPQEIVQEMAEVHGLSRGDLAALLGGRSRLSDFMNGVRDLSKGQALALRDRLHVPLDLLIR